MTIIYIILIIIAAIVIIVLVSAALSPGGYSIERTVDISRPQAEVFDYIKLTRNQENYSKWVMLDPNSRKTFTGTDGTVGFVYTWDSDNKQVGQGSQTITAITEGSEVKSTVKFIKPFEGSLDATMSALPAGRQTRVTWRIAGDRTFMLKVMHIVLNLQKTLGNDMAESLGNLKAVLEK